MKNIVIKELKMNTLTLDPRISPSGLHPGRYTCRPFRDSNIPPTHTHGFSLRAYTMGFTHAGPFGPLAKSSQKMRVYDPIIGMTGLRLVDVFLWESL